MKKWIALLAALVLCMGLTAYAEDAPVERTDASYVYTLAPGGFEYLENLIFHGDVVIQGERAQIVFVNCEFKGNIILTANEATRALLLGCDIAGTCIFQNEVTDADLVNYAHPKFMADSPVTVLCENGAGTLISLGDFECIFNDQTYTLASSELFCKVEGEELVLEPYQDQQANFYYVCQWYENGEKKITPMCEYDPTM